MQAVGVLSHQTPSKPLTLNARKVVVKAIPKAESLKVMEKPLTAKPKVRPLVDGHPRKVVYLKEQPPTQPKGNLRLRPRVEASRRVKVEAEAARDRVPRPVLIVDKRTNIMIPPLRERRNNRRLRESGLVKYGWFRLHKLTNSNSNKSNKLLEPNGMNSTRKILTLGLINRSKMMLAPNSQHSPG